MELLIPNSANLHSTVSSPPFFLSPLRTTTTAISFKPHHSPTTLPRLRPRAPPPITANISAAIPPPSSPASAPPPSTGWMVVMKPPPNAESATKVEVVNYFVQTLASVLPSEKEAQMCIYSASWQKDFFFCCDIDEQTSRELACIPEVLSVRPDRNLETLKEDNFSNLLLPQQATSDTHSSRFRPSGQNCNYWLVKMEKPGVEVVTKAQMVDYFAQTLTKVLGNENDAQVCIYHISWEKDYGFCCQIDEECARELSDVPGVLFVEPDVNFESENKNYKADDTPLEMNDSRETSSPPIVKTKRLFVTGLSFYTSEKTLRANFEPYGELVEVKIIMDKISKRSKGYAFIEYTTEEAASVALKEMNGKIINGWMIVVDVAKTNPPKYSRRPPRQPSSSSSLPYT